MNNDLHTPLEIRNEKYLNWLRMTEEVLKEIQYSKESWEPDPKPSKHQELFGVEPKSKYLKKTSDLYQVSVDLSRIVCSVLDDDLTVWIKR